MSSAKRTPRYVDAIRTFDVSAGGMSSDVIQLRPQPVGASLPPITKAWPRRVAVPVARRPWQLLLVSPMPGAAPRAFHVARWQVKLLIVVASVIVVIAGAGVTALVVALRSPDLFATSADAALLRERLSVVEDSLALARAELEGPDDSLAASAASATSELVPVPVASASRTARPTASPMVPARRGLSSRPATDDNDAAGSMGSSIENLPVIGAIASRFSRARRHPLLHIIRPHLGVDVAARRGTQITAPAPGRVTFVGRKFGFGLVLEIEHASGVKTRYAHCGSALVAVGAQVTRGMPIATVGTSGLSTGPHLHYEVLVHGHQVDPLRFRMPQVGDSAAVAPVNGAPTTGVPMSQAPVSAPAPIGAVGPAGSVAQSGAAVGSPK